MNNLESKIKICAVIPFYNEEKFVRNVVLKTLEYVDCVIAVNDGSTDNSESLIKDLKDVLIISSKVNKGKGFSLQSGFNKAIELNCDIVITLDADNQHNPELIPEFINASEDFDIVIGNRLDDIKNMPFMRILSNKITSFLLSVKTKQKIYDSQCGFRAIKSNVLKKVRTTFKGFEGESEMIVIASRCGFRIGFVGIPTIYANEKSKMKSLQAIKGFLRVILK